MNYKNIFGPINSRRFGISLGVDLSSSLKQCSFDCLYCELDKAKPIQAQNTVDDIKSIKSQLLVALKEYNDIDVITLSANGEPTLYPYLDELIDFINIHKTNALSLILSNGSTITNPNIQKSLSKLDIVKISLDAVTQKVFQRLDRPNNIKVIDIINSIKEYITKFNNNLIIEILFVKGINDSNDEIAKLVSVIQDINPIRLDLGTIDRPPSYNVRPISTQKLYQIADKFIGINTTVALPKKALPKNKSYTTWQILSTIKRRPLSKIDIDILFDERSKQKLDDLLKNKKVSIKKIANVDFVYIPN